MRSLAHNVPVCGYRPSTTHSELFERERETSAESISTPSELLHQLTHSAASAIFISPQLLPVLREALELGRSKGYRLDDSRIILLCPPSSKGKDMRRYKSVRQVWGSRRPAERFEDGHEQETAYLCYSSGTVRSNPFMNELS
jgi:long-subunit acyl-CoA synthetase (AMP-forming)